MKFIKNLTVIETSSGRKLLKQTQDLVGQFRKHRNWQKKWKLIFIMPNIEVFIEKFLTKKIFFKFLEFEFKQ